MPPRPNQGLPRGKIVISPTQDKLWFGLRQGVAGAQIQQQVVFPYSLSPRWQDLVRELDHFLRRFPLAKATISFRQENHMQVDVGTLRQSIKEWDAIRRDDLRKDHESAAHTAHSR